MSCSFESEIFYINIITLIYNYGKPINHFKFTHNSIKYIDENILINKTIIFFGFYATL